MAGSRRYRKPLVTFEYGTRIYAPSAGEARFRVVSSDAEGHRIQHRVATEAEARQRARARKHGLADDDMRHAIERSLAVGEANDSKVLYLGPDQAGNLLEVVTVARSDGTEVVIHSMPMRSKYEPFLRGEGDPDA